MSQIFGCGGGAKKRIHTGGIFRPKKMIRKSENGVLKMTRLVIFFCCMDKGLCSDIMLDSYDCENSLQTNLVPTPCITG